MEEKEAGALDFWRCNQRTKSKERKIMEIDVEVKEIDNGWIVKDNYFGETKFFKKWDDVSNEAKKRFTRFKKELTF